MKLIIEISDNYYKDLMSLKLKDYDKLSYEMAMIKNGTPFDKIRDEIEKQEKWLLQAGYNAYNVNIAFDAIRHAIA